MQIFDTNFLNVHCTNTSLICATEYQTNHRRTGAIRIVTFLHKFVSLEPIVPSINVSL